VAAIVVAHIIQKPEQSGNNQIKVTVASGGVDSCGGGGGQQRSTAVGGKMLTTKAIVVRLPTPLLLSLAGNNRAASAKGRK
jgi:hypothetical protein